MRPLTRAVALLVCGFMLGSLLVPVAAQQLAPADGQVAVRSDRAVYLIVNGVRRWVATVVVSDEELNAIPEGEPIYSGLTPAVTGVAPAAAPVGPSAAVPASGNSGVVAPFPNSPVAPAVAAPASVAPVATTVPGSAAPPIAAVPASTVPSTTAAPAATVPAEIYPSAAVSARPASTTSAAPVVVPTAIPIPIAVPAVTRATQPAASSQGTSGDIRIDVDSVAAVRVGQQATVTARLNRTSAACGLSVEYPSGVDAEIGGADVNPATGTCEWRFTIPAEAGSGPANLTVLVLSAGKVASKDVPLQIMR